MAHIKSSKSTLPPELVVALTPAMPGGAATTPAVPAAAAAFVKAIERLEEIVEQETNSLREHRHTDLQDFNHRKRHGLLELSHIVRALDPGPPHDRVRERLGSLRLKLEKNSAVLQTHLRAVREIASIVSRAIQDADSDGTYSAYGKRA